LELDKLGDDGLDLLVVVGKLVEEALGEDFEELVEHTFLLDCIFA